MNKVAAISVFFPAYNEEANIAGTVKKAAAVLGVVADTYEIIVVDDGSTDQTGQIVERLAKDNPYVRLVKHPMNQGYGAAIKSGLYSAKYPLIVYTDSDGQFNFGEISLFLEHLAEADMIIGYRLNRQEGLVRQFNAKGWTGLMRLLFHVHSRDVDCAFKLLKKQIIETIPRLEATGAMVSTELLAKAQKAGFRIVEVGVHHYPRTAGRPTGANITVILRAFLELFQLWGKLR